MKSHPILTALGALLGVALCVTATAFAAEFAPIPGPVPAPSDGVVIPWGNWLAGVIASAAVAIPAVVTWALSKAGPFGKVANALQLDRLLTAGLEAALNQTAGAVRGKTYTADTGIDLANKALAWAVRQAPDVVRAVGLDRTWREILAKVPFAEEAEVPADVQPKERFSLEAMLKRRLPF